MNPCADPTISLLSLRHFLSSSVPLNQRSYILIAFSVRSLQPLALNEDSVSSGHSTSSAALKGRVSFLSYLLWEEALCSCYLLSLLDRFLCPFLKSSVPLGLSPSVSISLASANIPVTSSPPPKTLDTGSQSVSQPPDLPSSTWF